MKIDCYLSAGCGSEDALKENIRRALDAGGRAASVRFHRIDAAEAMKSGLTGSPSVFIDGRELQPGPSPGFA
jgi:hypothetical protein